MRVAQLVSRFPSYSETFIHAPIAGLLRRGWDVDLYTFGEGQGEATSEEIQLIWDRARIIPVTLPNTTPRKLLRLSSSIRSTPLRTLRALLPWRHGRWAFSTGPLALLESWKRVGSPIYDIIHAHFGSLGRLSGALALESGSALVTSFRGYDLSYDLSRHGEDVYRNLFRSGDLFLPVCRLFADHLIELGAPTARVEVLHSGIQIARFPFIERRTSDGRVTLASVGRLIPRKGIDTGLRVLRALVDQGIDARYTIVGDGPARPALQTLASQLQLAGRVDWVGAVSPAQVPELLRNANVFLHLARTLPESREGIPNAIKEAMASGLLIVAARSGGIPELVQHGVTGLVLDPDRPEETAAVIAEVASDPDTVANLIRNARRFVESRFDAGLLTDRLVELYERVLRTSAG